VKGPWGWLGKRDWMIGLGTLLVLASSVSLFH